MSDPAYFFVDGEMYYSRGGARRVDDWLLWGPEVLDPYIKTLGPPCRHEHNMDMAFGGFALFKEEKRLLWFGGENTQTCPFYCRLFLRLQRAIWPKEWTIEWVGRGLQTLLAATGRPPEVESERDDLEDYWVNEEFQTLAKESSHQEFGTSGAVSVRNLDGSISLYPIHLGDVSESYLWAGPERILEALTHRLDQSTVSFPSEDVGFSPGGCHLDLREKTLSIWNHFPYIDPIPQQAWPGWTIVDWEHRFEEHLKATEGKLTVNFPDPQEFLDHMSRWFVASEPSEGSTYHVDHEVYDDDGQVVETIRFPLSLERRQSLWEAALKKTGLDAPLSRSAAFLSQDHTSD